MIKTKGVYCSDNILKEGNLIKLISSLKEKNKIIGLCVGAFDLLHAGHIAHFVNAKKYCDVLVVGVTSDKFVSKRKKGRPIFSEHLRVYSISQLKPVDYVFISDYLTANEAISLVRPDFYIKGPDYKDKDEEEINLERDSVKRVGGKMAYTSDEKLSTTEIVEHVKKLSG